MKLDDLLALTTTPESADDILGGAELVLSADDLSGNDRAGFATGFLMGLTYCLAMSNERRVPDAARTLLRLQREWEANGVL